MPVEYISLKRTAVLDPGVNCASTSAMWERGSHRGRGAGSLNRMMSTRPPAAPRPYGTFTRFVSALRRLLQAEADSVRRHSRRLLVDRGRVLREGQRAEVPEPLDPESDVMAAVRDARKLAIDRSGTLECRPQRETIAAWRRKNQERRNTRADERQKPEE